MKALSFRKFLIIFSMAALLIIIYVYTYTNMPYSYILNNPDSSKVYLKPLVKTFENGYSEEGNNTNLKYILQWTSPNNEPFVFMGKGQKGFIDRKCPYTNCFVTADRTYLGNYSKFDAIAFAGKEVVYFKTDDLPQYRSPHQKFVFATMESSDYYPICSDMLNGFFNWTWTYKLNSDMLWGYLAIRDYNGKVIGPDNNIQWIKLQDMKPVSDNLTKIFQNKTKTAAWFSSNCASRSRRESFVSQLQKELAEYGRSVDVYGGCGNLTCSRRTETDCNHMIENDYYFYLALENSFSEDYVTEKLLRALQFNAIPIVFGGANYSRFMPEGSYINAADQNVTNLAQKMNDLINDIDQYSQYFKWKKYYSYYDRSSSSDTDDYCSFCAMLNDEKKVKEITIYEDFRKWWDAPDRC